MIPKYCTSFAHFQQIHAHLLTTGLFHIYPSRSKFLDSCASTVLPYAVAIFTNISLPLTNDWNAIIRGHAQSHHPIKALATCLSMLRASCKPDALTCSFFLKACARALAATEAFQMHARVLKSGFQADVLLQTTLLDAQAKCGELDNALKLFYEMSSKDIASWNALISGMAQGNRPLEALELFKEMGVGCGMMPNEVTVLGALSACSQLGAVSEGDGVYEYIRNNRLEENVIVCNAVIDMYAKCGLVDKAYSVFEGMKCSRSVITWNTMIMGFAMDGDGVRAIQLFNCMDRGRMGGPIPDDVTYLACLCACNHAGLVEEGLRVFRLMDRHGICKNVKHYGSVVDLLGRAGRLDEAYETILSMPMFPDAVLWQTLLGASKTHGNVKMAENASRNLVEIGSSTCGILCCCPMCMPHKSGGMMLGSSFGGNFYQLLSRNLKSWAVRIPGLPGRCLIFANTEIFFVSSSLQVWGERRNPGHAFINSEDRKDAQDVIKELDVFSFFRSAISDGHANWVVKEQNSNMMVQLAECKASLESLQMENVELAENVAFLRDDTKGSFSV
ncbi:pentatricopeptide repeat-containing protein-like [Dorcoceras hygrometricum]|uniref:Pentatricopeptide repeat-containing protein-like n=1 Tax=Dorcoceras hygrometricum TaxID=472368 RepID=A0A2Z7AQT8_9LAMI|nr:pentatricopeptide repeat-containing protein-like [Dorcoceras hygrometricum]